MGFSTRLHLAHLFHHPPPAPQVCLHHGAEACAQEQKSRRSQGIQLSLTQWLCSPAGQKGDMA